MSLLKLPINLTDKTALCSLHADIVHIHLVARRKNKYKVRNAFLPIELFQRLRKNSHGHKKVLTQLAVLDRADALFVHNS